MTSKEFLKYMLQKTGYSTRRLSLAMGRTPSFISNSIYNNKSITVGNLAEIGEILGFEVVVRTSDEEFRLEDKSPA